MHIGCCTNMIGSKTDPLGAQWFQTLKSAGYDYVELPMALVMDLDSAALDDLRAKLDKSGLACECCNCFVRADVRLTGPDADMKAAEEYLRESTRRASLLGAEILVFGSAGAKNVPDGFPIDKAFAQLADFLKIAAGYCEKNNVKIAIEPLNKKETNITLSVGEAAELMEAAGSTRIRVLADYYHFALENDSIDVLNKLTKSGDIIHTHFAEVEGRVFPSSAKGEYMDFFNTLKSAGYGGRCSIEAVSPDPEAELPSALKIMRSFM